MPLTTPRLGLRPFTPSDRDWLHPIASDPTVTRYTDWGPNSPEDTEAFLADAVHATGPEVFAWAVTLLDGTGIGSAGLHITSREHRRASFGYVLGAQHWGHGLGTEVARAVVGVARGLGLHRLEATCHPDNAASARVLVKAGLSPEGHLRDHLFVRGAWRDSLLFAVLLEVPAAPSGPARGEAWSAGAQ